MEYKYNETFMYVTKFDRKTLKMPKYFFKKLQKTPCNL